MKMVLLAVGKTGDSPWNEALKVYCERLKHYFPFEIEIVHDVKNTGNMPEAQQKVLEGVSLLKSLQTGDSCVLLDEKGKEYTSVQFAAWIERKMHTVPKRLVFMAGGPFGFSEAVYQAVPEMIALSRMTFSHQMVRPVFVEQLYRAMTILRNEAYHHR